MNKMTMIGLGFGGAVLGYLIYKYYLTPSQIYSTTSLNPNTQAGPFTTSGTQTYPFQANVAPRVDNSNQPWANNNRAALAQVSAPQLDVNLSNANMIASYTKSLATISSAASSIWEDLGVSDWFSSGDSDAFTADFSFDTDDLTSSDIFSGGSNDFNFANVG